MSSVSLLHWKQHFCFPEFSVFCLCANTHCLERFIYEAAQTHTPCFKVFSCLQGFPCFQKPGFVPGKFTSYPSLHPLTARILTVPSCHRLLQGSGRSAGTWLLRFAAPPGAEARCVSKTLSLHSLLRCLQWPFPHSPCCRKYLAAKYQCKIWEERWPLHLKLPFKQVEYLELLILWSWVCRASSGVDVLSAHCMLLQKLAQGQNSSSLLYWQKMKTGIY